MAKTKKELQDQVPEEEQAVADTGLIESESVPQTDLERLPPALTDLELEATNTLDPDAPQSDLDLGGPMDDQIPAPETRSEAGEPPSDLTQPDAEPVLQTGLEMDQELDQLPGEPTRPELEPAQEPEMPSETEPVPTEDTDDAQPPKRRRRNTRKKAEETEADAETETETPSEEEQSDVGQPQKLRMPGRRRQRVVSIDAERTVETDTDRLRSDLLDLVESFKSKRILTGTIQGVERLADNPEMSYAVIYPTKTRYAPMGRVNRATQGRMLL